MRAIRLEEPKHFEYVEIDEPGSPGPDQALVRTHRMGICGTDYSGYLGEYVAACGAVLSEAGLETRLHAYGTNIEGEWDDVFAAIKRCHEVVHEMGAPRITTTIKLGTRTDRAQTMDDKVRSVEAKTAGSRG